MHAHQFGGRDFPVSEILLFKNGQFSLSTHGLSWIKKFNRYKKFMQL